jgi:hypothetical protein
VEADERTGRDFVVIYCFYFLTYVIFMKHFMELFIATPIITIRTEEMLSIESCNGFKLLLGNQDDSWNGISLFERGGIWIAHLDGWFSKSGRTTMESDHGAGFHRDNKPRT